MTGCRTCLTSNAAPRRLRSNWQRIFICLRKDHFFRKGEEAILTIFLERELNKRRILELYLNVIEWGDGIYGAEAAAEHYFHKSASALSANEAAFLAAMIPNPRTVFNPQVNARRVARRQRIILRGMPYIRVP